jgi:hypothetical protein
MKVDAFFLPWAAACVVVPANDGNTAAHGKKPDCSRHLGTMQPSKASGKQV